jgi:hypothetical protein
VKAFVLLVLRHGFRGLNCWTHYIRVYGVGDEL